MLDPSPHPDQVWLKPPGTQHLVAEIREQVILGASYSPFESNRRVFVIEAAEAMGDESQNGLLKTLEEPPAYAHLILLTSAPAEVLDTVKSRCQPVHFVALSAAAIADRLAEDGELDAGQRTAAASLSNGDLERARFLVTEPGDALRRAAERLARAPIAGESSQEPWLDLLAAATAGGDADAELVEARAAELAEELGEGREADRAIREGADAAKRAARRRRTQLLDMGLSLCGAWLRDLLALANQAPESVANSDRMEELAADAALIEAQSVRRGVELVLETRRRLEVNVSEQLALEAMCFRLEALLHG